MYKSRNNMDKINNPPVVVAWKEPHLHVSRFNVLMWSFLAKIFFIILIYYLSI